MKYDIYMSINRVYALQIHGLFMYLWIVRVLPLLAAFLAGAADAARELRAGCV